MDDVPKMYPEMRITQYQTVVEAETLGAGFASFAQRCKANAAATGKKIMESSPSIPPELRTQYRKLSMKGVAKPVGRLGKRKTSTATDGGEDDLEFLDSPFLTYGKRTRQLSISESLEELEGKERVRTLWDCLCGGLSFA